MPRERLAQPVHKCEIHASSVSDYCCYLPGKTEYKCRREILKEGARGIWIYHDIDPESSPIIAFSVLRTRSGLMRCAIEVVFGSTVLASMLSVGFRSAADTA